MAQPCRLTKLDPCGRMKASDKVPMLPWWHVMEDDRLLEGTTTKRESHRLGAGGSAWQRNPSLDHAGGRDLGYAHVG